MAGQTITADTSVTTARAFCRLVSRTDAASASGQIAANINSVADVARNTTASVDESRYAAEELDEVSRKLQTLVGGFRV